MKHISLLICTETYVLSGWIWYYTFRVLYNNTTSNCSKLDKLDKTFLTFLSLVSWSVVLAELEFKPASCPPPVHTKKKLLSKLYEPYQQEESSISWVIPATPLQTWQRSINEVRVYGKVICIHCPSTGSQGGLCVCVHHYNVDVLQNWRKCLFFGKCP